MARRYFWVLGTPNKQIPSKTEWRDALTEIQDELKEDIGDRYYSIQWVRQPAATPIVFAQLAVQILKITRPFLPVSVLSDKGVEVIREADFWAENIELLQGLKPSLILTIQSSII
jgi:hypothetical protein